jgi:ABC-type multidrug transport system fused ATPase/permease subunit
MFSLLGGIVLAFIFSWKVALVALAIVPFMVIGSAISAKVNKAKSETQDTT